MTAGAGVRAGAVLPELVIDVTPTFVVASAIATRDFQDVHHDRDQAVARGGQDIFINILTTTGLVQRYVTDWAGPRGPGAQGRDPARRAALRGGHAHVLGQVAESDGGEVLVEVTGRCRLGDHVTGTVRVVLPPEGSGA